jgi:hypothetical protein
MHTAIRGRLQVRSVVLVPLRLHPPLVNIGQCTATLDSPRDNAAYMVCSQIWLQGLRRT